MENSKRLATTQVGHSPRFEDLWKSFCKELQKHRGEESKEPLKITDRHTGAGTEFRVHIRKADSGTYAWVHVGEGAWSTLFRADPDQLRKIAAQCMATAEQVQYALQKPLPTGVPTDDEQSA